MKAGVAKRARWVLLSFCALGALFLIATTFDLLGLNGRPWYGWWDSYRYPSGTPYALVFKPPRPGGATANAEIRGGDLADLREQSYAARVILLTQTIATQHTAVKIRRGSQTIDTTVLGSTIWDGEPLWKLLSVLPSLLADLWFLVCAFLVAQRRAESRDARVLATVLLCLVPGFFPQEAPVWPSPSATLVTWGLTEMLGLFGLALLAWLASEYGTRSRLRGVLTACTYAALAIAALRLLAYYTAIVSLAFDPLPFYVGTFAVAPMLASALGVLLCSISAVLSADRSQRSRAGWLLLPLPAAILASMITYFAPATANWFNGVTINSVGTVLLLGGALAVTYALLRRRVLDIGFVLSRTLVVAGVSLIVVVAFILLEWGLGTTLAGVSHTTGIVANAALALALGLSMRYIHSRVDLFVDTVFFRKRHEDEKAIATFAREAPYVTDARTLLARTEAVLAAHTDAEAISVIVENAAGDYAGVDENDPAILRLRATSEVVDLHHVDSALVGDLAFPMVARGRLIGVIVLGERRSGEAYAPDEQAAIAHLAQSVGVSLDAVLKSPSKTGEDLRDSLAAGFAALGEKIDALRREITAEPNS